MMRPPEVVVGGTTRTFFRGGPWAWLLSGLPVCPAPLVWLLACCCCWFFCWFRTTRTQAFINRTQQRREITPQVLPTHSLLKAQLQKNKDKYTIFREVNNNSTEKLLHKGMKCYEVWGTHISYFLGLVLRLLLRQKLSLGVGDLTACEHTEDIHTHT